jgi:Ubiquitin carboxyl-terminal hydrolase
VGTTVHSGTAHAGHYWSYINTKRGHSEPDSSDPNWEKTEGDTWMEFNDSTVKNFNFEKLKEECYGQDGAATGGGSDSWGFGGSYGKSAYMLIYERREKKPIKILVPQEEAKALIAEGQDVKHDAKRDEYFTLLDYKRGVETIDPSQIYRQVAEDNQKFEFDNDIYSQEFFEFIRSILLSVKDSLTQRQDTELMAQVKGKALQVGKRTIMDLLAKCYHNAAIKQMVEVVIDIMK